MRSQKNSDLAFSDLQRKPSAGGVIFAACLNLTVHSQARRGAGGSSIQNSPTHFR